jgi:transglutaminase/protease-like cytokinesis protein 3
MTLFLEKLDIPNIKIATNKHVWNLVYLNNNWYHLDLTWNDPINDNGEDILSHKFFLISTEELRSHNTEDHSYNIDIYAEAQ